MGEREKEKGRTFNTSKAGTVEVPKVLILGSSVSCYNLLMLCLILITFPRRE